MNKTVNRFMLGLVAGGVVFGAVAGSAAALGTDGGVIQQGVDSTLACDTDGVYVAGWGLETDDSTVRNIRIGGIDPACVGAKVFLKVDRTSLASNVDPKVSLTVANVTENFAFTPFLPVADIAGLEVFIQQNGS